MGRNLIILFFIMLLGCKKQDSVVKENNEVYAVNIFSTGKILLNNQEFKVKNLLKENEEIILSPRSICDLQIVKHDWLLRIHGDGKFQLKPFIKDNSQENWVLYLQEGTLFAKINQKLNDKESFQIITPASIIGVRGTQFKIEVDKEGKTKVSVAEGKVVMRLTPTESFVKNSSQVLPMLEKVEITLEKDKTLELNKEFWKNLETIPSEKKEIYLEQVTKLSAKSVVESKSDVKASLQKEFANISGLPLTAFQEVASLNKSIEARIQEKTKELLQLMAEVSTKKKGTIVLQSGEEISGLIEKKDKTITIETPLKTMNFQESEVLEISYE
ncbi:MAG: FecR family protein [Leptospiraceae bacterium]|nr:FecR family protein [Leptospiraceae bacterium]